MKRPRYRRLRKPGARYCGRRDTLAVSIVRCVRKDGTLSYRWKLVLG